MKAVEASLLPFMSGNKQFVIPIYQRPYSWTIKQCSQLWSDILKAARDDAVFGHFIGSIVYITQGPTSATLPQYLVIDGQQRLTTVSLLLAALGKAIEANRGSAEVSGDEIQDLYLTNRHGKGDLRYKLVLTQSDREVLSRLVEDQPLPSSASPRVVENYQFFVERIANATMDHDALYNGLAKLVIVDVALDGRYDNPQLIFESLNSTGLDLSQSDLIRNYVLMGLEVKDQEEVYNLYWHPMEVALTDTQHPEAFDGFMRDYLTVKTGRIPNINDVYPAFKAYVQDSSSPIKEIVADIHRYATYYVQFAFERSKDKVLKEIFGDINALRVNVAYPFMLELLDDYAQGHVTREDLLEILRLVESYIFRRSICGIPTNTLNKTFAGLAREVDRGNYLESVKAAFLLKDSYRRFPPDDEFAAELVVKDVYNFRTRNYLLRKLENYGRKEKVVVENYTIEHVMPQNPNLSPEWQRELGPNWEELQARYLHTLGNLTLTGYNSQLSDRPFEEKRTIPGGFVHSPLQLNESLAQLHHWNEDAIRRRAATLASIALKVWAAPKLPVATLDGYRKTVEPQANGKYTLADHPGLQGEMLSLFEHIRTRILNLDASVREEIKKVYIAYKTTTNFVDVAPQKKALLLTLNMRFDEINDPKKLCKDVTGVGVWGNGDVQVSLSSLAQLDDVMDLIRQSFERHSEDEGE